jgi:hypothetical protein
MINKRLLVLSLAFVVMLSMTLLVSAAAPSMSISNWYNATTSTGNLSITVDVIAAENVTNVSCYYNASGGPSYPTLNLTYLGSSINSSKGQTSFTIPGTIATEYAHIVNVTCMLFNDSDSAGKLELPGGNGSVSRWNITIDGTAPTLTLSIEQDRIAKRDSELLVWTGSDSGTGMQSVSLTTVSSDTTNCPTVTSTTTIDGKSATAGQDALIDEQTVCSGEYTVTWTATDYSGNKETKTGTFTVMAAGLTKSGSNTLGGSSKSSLSDGNEVGNSSSLLGTGNTKSILLIVVIVIFLYFVLKKK